MTSHSHLVGRKIFHHDTKRTGVVDGVARTLLGFWSVKYRYEGDKFCLQLPLSTFIDEHAVMPLRTDKVVSMDTYRRFRSVSVSSAAFPVPSENPDMEHA